MIGILVRALLAMVALGLASTSLAAPPAEGGPRIFLSWRAPYGTTGATPLWVPSCEDSLSEDSLYLSIEVPRTRPPVDSMYVAIDFVPAPGDTLGSFWHFRSGWENQRNMWIDLVPYAPLPAPTVWDPGGPRGIFNISYDHRSGKGRLEVAYRVPSLVTPPLNAAQRYCLMRVRILHQRHGLGGCMQPICVDWADARIHFSTGREMVLPAVGQPRVSWAADCSGAETAKPTSAAIPQPPPGR